MKSQVSKRIFKGIGVLFLGAILITGWGAWKWRHLANPDLTSLRAWDVAPSSTVYFYYVPNVPQFYSRFFKYHVASFKSPTLETANRNGATNPLLRLKPIQYLRPGTMSLLAAAGSVALFDYFIAMLPPPEGRRELSFLLGGKCLNASFASWKLRRALSKTGFNWTEYSNSRRTLHFGSDEGWQVVVGTVGDWLFIADEPGYVRDAIQAVATKGRGTLGESAAFQESRDATLRDAILWVYTDVLNLVGCAAETGIPEAGAVIQKQMPWLKAAAYSFINAGPKGIACDLMSYTLKPKGTKIGNAELRPIDPSFFDTTTPETLSVMTTYLDFGKLANWPLLKPDVVEKLANEAPGLPQPSRQLVRMVKRPSPGVRTTNWGIFEKRQSGNSAKEAQWAADAGALPGAPKPFIEIRLNYRGIVEGLMEELKADWSAWKSAGEKRGLPMPDSPPHLDVAEYFAWTRFTAGFEGNTFCIYHSLQLGKMGNTQFSALNELTTIFFEQEMQDRLAQFRRPFARVGDSDSPAWANPLDVGYISCLFLSPVFTNHNAGTIATNVVILDLLAGVSRAPAN